MTSTDSAPSGARAVNARAYQGKPAYRGLVDGKHLFIFSQSGLKSVGICPERGRRDLLKLHPRTYTDSTTMGEAFHLAVELCLQSIIDEQGRISPDDLYCQAADHFDEIMALEGSRWVKIKTPETVYKYLYQMIGTWYTQCLPGLSPQAVELHLGPYTIYEDEHRLIQLEGTADYLDAVTGLADWKTAGREWNEQEHQRWDIQPTVYTWLRYGTAFGVVWGDMPWTWHVFQTNGKYQKIETTRGPDDWAWLREQCLGLAIQLEANLPVWITNSSHHLCSAKWCDAWAECKGKHVPPPITIEER